MTNDKIQRYIEYRILRWKKVCWNILDFFQCHKCGWCCIKIPVFISDDEIKILAEICGVPIKRFQKKFCSYHGTEISLKEPCPFLLQDNSCMLYPSGDMDVRPLVCKFYPFSVDRFVLFGIERCQLSKNINEYVVKIGDLPNINELIKKKTHHLDQKISDLVHETLPFSRQKIVEEIEEKINEKYRFEDKTEEMLLTTHPEFLEVVLDYLKEKVGE